uniref:Odorant binding protein 26 n=1 Tax=Holotrichia parallela TaxID=93412 RepID=A0A0S2UX32_HOLPA|nr:odorant binding protein 26 [Holotrichia parallela]
MKHIISFLLISVFMLFQKSHCFEIPDHADECLQELGMDSSELQDLREKRRDNIEPTHNGKCLALCIAKRGGYVKDTGVNEEAILKGLPAGVSVNFEQCRPSSDADDCEKFYKIFECLRQQIPKKPTK